MFYRSMSYLYFWDFEHPLWNWVVGESMLVNSWSFQNMQQLPAPEFQESGLERFLYHLKYVFRMDLNCIDMCWHFWHRWFSCRKALSLALGPSPPRSVRRRSFAKNEEEIVKLLGAQWTKGFCSTRIESGYTIVGFLRLWMEACWTIRCGR